MELLYIFFLGLAFGSFLNVVALRYDPQKPIWSDKVIGGRSRCPHCRRTLRWFELVPLLSFAALGGRCRTCHVKISWRYPAVELGMGLLFMAVPLRLVQIFFLPQHLLVQAAIWCAIAAVLVVIALIDQRTRIIPDEAVIFLVAAGIVLRFLPGARLAAAGSFLGPYAMLFGNPSSAWVGAVLAILVAAAVFGGLILITRGRGMGWGDFKMALALAIIFGWPDIVVLIALAFIVGTLIYLPAVLARRTELKQTLAFGPFLAVAAGLVFFVGREIVENYLRLVGF